MVFRSAAVAPPGALVILYAAITIGAEGGDYYGPRYIECYGSLIREDPSTLSKSEMAASKLWRLARDPTRSLRGKYIRSKLN